MLHLETLQSATRRQYASLQEEVASIPATITVTKDKPYSYVSDVFEDSVRILGRDTCIRRVHVKASDTGYYRNIGWMHDNDVHHCLVCLRSFGWFFDPKEHCHACGSIVCGSCVDKAMIVELKGCGDVTVGKCCYWGQEQITIVETRPPRSKIVYGDAHNRYNDTFNKSKSDSGSDSESLLDGNNINENETETVELFNLREDKSRLQMMDLLRQSADFAHSANVARSDSRDNNLSSLSKGGDRRRGANHYGTSFRPCSERMFAPYIEPPSLKSKSMDSNRHFRWLPSVSLTSRTCSEDFRARKAVSVDEPTRPHSANLRFFGGKQREVDALSEGMHPRSRILSEENDIVDFTLGGRHLHQGFRYDRDATGGDIVGYNTSSVAGQAMLTYDCMEFKQELCVHSIEARTLKEAAHRNNRVLLGWQVLILRKNLTLLGLGVITAVYKGLQRQSYYRISTDTNTDCWLRLKKSQRQAGTEFQPLRKVLHGLTGSENVDFSTETKAETKNETKADAKAEKKEEDVAGAVSGGVPSVHHGKNGEKKKKNGGKNGSKNGRHKTKKAVHLEETH